MATESRAELDAELAQWIPTMLADTHEASQMVAYAGRLELIEEAAAPIDRMASALNQGMQATSIRE